MYPLCKVLLWKRKATVAHAKDIPSDILKL